MEALRSRILIRVFRSRFIEDFAFLLAVTLASAFYVYEKNLPFGREISFVLTISVLTAWIWLSFTSGFMRRRVFLIFTLVYWLLPQFVIIRFQDITIRDYTTVLHISSRVSGLLVRAPLNSISDLLNVSSFITGMFLLLMCAVAFLSGYIYRDKCGSRHWYRVFRERYDRQFR
ncbi:MAG: hypothetical protein LBC86_06830 [Oscillospiraceae bacterium]|jgi:hypothetical protein|nr:hypothetical protein [Oscillospiraceae bacterium]